MGIDFDDQNVDVSGVNDRRGGGGGGFGGPVAIGGGGLGHRRVIVFVLLQVLGGGGGSGGLPSGAAGRLGRRASGADESDLATRCNPKGAIDQYDDCFLVKVYNEVNEVWTDEFARAGETYEQPALTFFTQAVNTGCGQASSEVGPFYCPPDQSIYIDIGFLDQLQQQFGAAGPLRAGVHPGARGRAPPADAVRHRAQGPLGPAGRPEQAERSCRSRSSCRPTATPGCGASSPTTPATSPSGTPRCSRPRTPPRPSVTTGSSSRPRAGSTGVLDPRVGGAAQEWFTTGRPPAT